MDSNICVKKYLANVNNVVQELRYYFDVVIKSTFPWFWQERLKIVEAKLTKGDHWHCCQQCHLFESEKKERECMELATEWRRASKFKRFFFGTFGLKVKTKVWNFGQDLKNKLLARIDITEKVSCDLVYIWRKRKQLFVKISILVIRHDITLSVRLYRYK